MTTTTDPAADQIRFGADGSIMMWRDGEPCRCPTGHDMDHLPVGPDMTEEEVELLDEATEIRNTRQDK